jgi:hypothetical protein
MFSNLLTFIALAPCFTIVAGWTGCRHNESHSYLDGNHGRTKLAQAMEIADLSTAKNSDYPKAFCGKQFLIGDNEIM